MNLSFCAILIQPLVTGHVHVESVRRKMKGFPTGLTKYMDVSIGSATSVDDVKNSLVNYGSISTAIMSSPLDIHHILFPQNAAAVAKGQDIPQAADKCPYNGKSIDHAVTIVGWTPCTVRQDL